MPVFYEVATLDDTTVNPPYAVMRIDTDKRVGAGCEGVVVSLHYSKDEAKVAADLASAQVGGRA